MFVNVMDATAAGQIRYIDTKCTAKKLAVVCAAGTPSGIVAMFWYSIVLCWFIGGRAHETAKRRDIWCSKLYGRYWVNRLAAIWIWPGVDDAVC